MTEQLYTIDGYDDGTPDVRDDKREANDLIAEAAKRLHFVSRIPFICECSDQSCRAVVLLHEQEYADRRRTGIRIVLTGHAAAARSGRLSTSSDEAGRPPAQQTPRDGLSPA